MAIEQDDAGRLPAEEREVDALLREFFRKEVPDRIDEPLSATRSRTTGAPRRRPRPTPAVIAVCGAGIAAAAVVFAVFVPGPTPESIPPVAEDEPTERTSDSIDREPVVAERPADDFAESPVFVIDEPEAESPIKPASGGAGSRTPDFGFDEPDIEVFSLDESLEEAEAGSAADARD